MVDVWDDHTDPILSENERLRLLPLLDAARKAGMLIIHAPSEVQALPLLSHSSVLSADTFARPTLLPRERAICPMEGSACGVRVDGE